MKAAVATGIQDIDQYLHVQDDWPQPTLATAIDGKTGKRANNDTYMIVKVLACALAPGDCRLFGGKTDLAQLPKSGRPYVIGSDICGIVTEVFQKENESGDDPKFKIGDKIIARFDEPQPHGMCAEYACVKTELSEHCPASIPAIQACTLPASAAAAKLVATRYIKRNDRVLVLGASGGVGTFLCQYIKRVQGAAFLAATTTQKELATSILGVDRIIDYRKENWWELESEFQNEPFDVVVDLVNGPLNWPVGACSSRTKVLKPKAPYLQLLSGVETELDMRSIVFDIIPFVFRLMISRPLYCKLHPKGPQWVGPPGLELQPGDLKGILEDVTEKRIQVVLDPSSPFSFDTEGVRDAMKLQRSIHAHGKVVIDIAKEPK
jgi:NADPH:quinone reductase-like Zn-dependent oxidoreductase